jgi:hypothetical protein
MRKKYKFGIGCYFQPTPRNLVNMGNALVGAATFGAGVSWVADRPTVSLALLVLGMIGKFVTEFFAMPEPEPIVEQTIAGSKRRHVKRTGGKRRQ